MTITPSQAADLAAGNALRAAQPSKELVAGTEPATNVPATVDKRVAQYVQVRDAIKTANDAHAEAIKPMVELQNMLTGWLQTFMEQAGADSVKTSHGTCYSTTRYSASLADPEAFMKFVKENDLFDLLDRKANVTACRDYTEERGVTPPGVNLSSIKTVGVRRASGK